MANFIMSGPMQALGFILMFGLLSMFLPFLGLLSNAAIGLVTLRLGWRRGLMLALVASVAMGVIALLMQGSLSAVLGSDLLTWGMVVALAGLLQHTASWKYLIQAVFALGAVGVLLFHMNVADPGAVWKSAVQSLLDLDSLQERLPEVDLQDLLNKAASYMTGVVATVIGFSFVLSLMIARHWQAMLYNPGGFQQELREIQLSRLAGILMVVAITLAFAGTGPLLLDMIMVGLGMFLFQGVALVHGVRVILNVNPAWLLAVYLPMAVMPVQVGILLAAFGIIDSIADFRSFLARNRPKA